jgi:hypothetical protein
LWYLAKAVSSFVCMAAACFRDFTSCSSNVSARAPRRRTLEASPTSGGFSQQRPA